MKTWEDVYAKMFVVIVIYGSNKIWKQPRYPSLKMIK